METGRDVSGVVAKEVKVIGEAEGQWLVVEN
jgi:hypothetical protein